MDMVLTRWREGSKILKLKQMSYEHGPSGEGPFALSPTNVVRNSSRVSGHNEDTPNALLLLLQ